MEFKPNAITDTGNHKIRSKIGSLNEFWAVIERDRIIYARHRIYPSAFFYSWQIKEIMKWINNGWFWTADKIEED